MQVCFSSSVDLGLEFHYLRVELLFKFSVPLSLFCAPSGHHIIKIALDLVSCLSDISLRLCHLLAILSLLKLDPGCLLILKPGHGNLRIKSVADYFTLDLVLDLRGFLICKVVRLQVQPVSTTFLIFTTLFIITSFPLLSHSLIRMIVSFSVDVAKIAWLGLALELFELLLSFHGFVAVIDTVLVYVAKSARLHLIFSLLDQLIKVKIFDCLLDLLLSFHGLVAVIVSISINVAKIAWFAAQMIVTMIDSILIDVAKIAWFAAQILVTMIVSIGIDVAKITWPRLFLDLFDLLLGFYGFVTVIYTVLVYVA